MDEEDDPPPGVPEWVVTYGDMMSLLLTFFIMLVSMSELKEEGKLRRMMDALNQRFGMTAGAAGVPGPSDQTSSVLADLSSDGSRQLRGTKTSSRNAAGRGGRFGSVRSLADGPSLTLGGPAAFAPHSAALTPEAADRLRDLAGSLRRSTLLVTVRGHASVIPLPSGSAFGDAFDLSHARAVAAADLLAEAGLGPARVRVEAAGDSEPVAGVRPELAGSASAPADARDRLRANDRVDVFLSDTYRPAVATGPAP